MSDSEYPKRFSEINTGHFAQELKCEDSTKFQEILQSVWSLMYLQKKEPIDVMNPNFFKILRNRISSEKK